MTRLETQIHQALESLVVPDTDLVESVLAELPLHRSPVRHRRPVLATAVAVLAIAIGIVAAVAPAREAIADWLGIGATELQSVNEVDLPDRSSVEDLGDPVASTTLRETQPEDTRASVSPIPSLGEPSGVFDDSSRGRSYTWSASANLPAIGSSDVGAVLSVRPADRVLSAKVIANDVEFGPVELASLSGDTIAFWINGQHVLVQTGSSRRVSANQVLLWVADGVEIRLETSLELPEVVRLAQEIVEGTELLAPG